MAYITYVETMSKLLALTKAWSSREGQATIEDVVRVVVHGEISDASQLCLRRLPSKGFPKQLDSSERWQTIKEYCLAEETEQRGQYRPPEGILGFIMIGDENNHDGMYDAEQLS